MKVACKVHESDGTGMPMWGCPGCMPMYVTILDEGDPVDNKKALAYQQDYTVSRTVVPARPPEDAWHIRLMDLAEQMVAARSRYEWLMKMTYRLAAVGAVGVLASTGAAVFYELLAPLFWLGLVVFIAGVATTTAFVAVSSPHEAYNEYRRAIEKHSSLQRRPPMDQA